ncbi:MAG: DUF169 domain-containing protein [Deltaproteobacteria bacterium]|nr:DUF169 domain-containing protein [Deltaproteobacteria bacterium]MBF0525113.1 DUF169 domain-containing protein [Deltaproteobacteria bacterium]
MTETNYLEAAKFIRDDLRLKTFPVAVKFLKDKADFPEKTRRPSMAMGKRIAICQGLTMARNYGWTVGLAKEDVICVPAAIVFGFSGSADQTKSLARLFCKINFAGSDDLAQQETSSMCRFAKGEIEGILLAPLEKASFEPDTIVIYGNPAQVMRLTQAWSYLTGDRVAGLFGGKVECDECLIAPFKTQSPRVVIPGHGERIFAATQDDELVFAFPGKFLLELTRALPEVGKAIGARYPGTPYQNFQPDFPKAHKELGKELGIL